MPKRYRDIVDDGGSNIPAPVEELQRLPLLARPVARMAISRYARERGRTTVPPELMDEYRARMGF